MWRLFSTQPICTTSWRRSIWLAVTVLLLGFPAAVQAQVAPPLKIAETPAAAPQEEPPRSSQDRLTEISQRLKEAEVQADEAKQQAREPAEALKRRIETLSRMELILSQLADEQGKQEKLAEEQKKAKAELDQFIQVGLDDKKTVSFLEFDQLHEDLQDERRRLVRIADKEKSALVAFEKAQEDLSAANTQRRLAKDKLEGNANDQLRQSLGESLAIAIEESELVKMELELHRQESVNAKLTREIQEHQVKILEEQETRLKQVVQFGHEELAKVGEELDRQEDDLKKRIEKFESAAEPRLRYVDEQYIAARRNFDSISGDKVALNQQIQAFELEYRVLREVAPLLRGQLELVKKDRQAWHYRQRVFSQMADREKMLEWEKNSSEALSQIKRESRKTAYEIDELREKIDAVESKQKTFQPKSPELLAAVQQLASLRSLLNYYQESLGRIRSSTRLHEKLQAELASDSLATAAQYQLNALWERVTAAWHFVLMTTGEGPDEQTVTVQKVVTALLILLAGVILSKAISRILVQKVLRRLKMDASASATIQSLFYYLLLLLFGLYALHVARVPLTAFTVLGGAVALGVGFGSQNIINNFISGLILLAERPVKVGDLIQLDGGSNGEKLFGNVEHIGARSTRLRSGSNLEIIVPNSSFLQSNVINYTLSSDKLRISVNVGVVYGSPTTTVTQLLRRAVMETGRVSKDPPPIILFKNFGENSLDFEIHFWIRMRTMMDRLQIESAVRFRVDQLFREEGIVIAFPQRDVHLDATKPLEVRIAPPSDPETEAPG